MILYDLIRLFFIPKSGIDLSTNDKMTANRIFGLNYGVYDQKKFSWIYMNNKNQKSMTKM
jgi:hypothetical protein